MSGRVRTIASTSTRVGWRATKVGMFCLGVMTLACVIGDQVVGSRLNKGRRRRLAEPVITKEAATPAETA